MNILHLEYDKYPSTAIELLRKRHVVTPFNCYSQAELYRHLKANKYDVIFTRLGLYMDSICIDYQSNTLKFIATSTTGLNHINVDYANQLGIEVVSLRGDYEFLSRIKSTAEHTWGLLLMLIRHMNEAVMSTKSRKWDRNPFMSDELSEKTLGIIGYGRLGKIVAHYGVAFGMKVLVYDCDKKQTCS